MPGGRAAIALAVGIAFLGGVAAGEAPEPSLSAVLKLDDVISVMHDEGLRYAKDLEDDMLDGQGGQFFHDEVDRIYDPDRMVVFVENALAEGLSDAQRRDAIAFFGTDLGQRILSLENAARVAMSDPAVEEIARAAHDDILDTGDRRLGAVTRFVEVNDLVDRNVASALGSNFRFFRGLADGRGARTSDREILADVWAQEAELRDDTESWLFAFLLMAYRPLSDTELDAYVTYSETDGGQALNAAIFAGFDAMYLSISEDLGRAAARAMAGSDI
ncbi:DUF2059 domain-containing protein [Sedimentitalea sp. JM2-8]|uniref:DUF2059 domain-containing protein n=1 Tax=Sedimentitalea xiamensis TaxID=3050037 RepID=A0ABT7FC54_9RHOB|nr:DUF2059 domain-containing protein [Sedimentitalea xiamensis]MDK3072698.1 DUF2059 domain-containing protein [Sedimentitalea xiamensis]